MIYFLGSMLAGQALALVLSSAMLSWVLRRPIALLLALVGIAGFALFFWFSTPYGGQAIDFTWGVALTGPPRYPREGLHLVGTTIGVLFGIAAGMIALFAADRAKMIGRASAWSMIAMLVAIAVSRHATLEQRYQRLDGITEGLRRHTGEALHRVMPDPVPLLEDPAFVTEEVVSGLEVPDALAPAPDGRIFVGEQKGRILVLHPDAKEPQVVLQLEDVRGRVEGGLLNLVLHPSFETEPYLYFYFTRDSVAENRIERLRLKGDQVEKREVVFTGLPGHRMHNGGAMAFGTDGKLYVGTGTADHRSLSREIDVPARPQGIENLYGKMLRLNPDGSIPDDNPIQGSPVYSLGFRMPFRAMRDPISGAIFVTENGSEYHDEINVASARANFGHPIIRGFSGMPGYEDPLLDIRATIGITGLMFYQSGSLPQRFENDLFFCSYVTGLIYWVPLGRSPADRMPRDVVQAIRPSNPNHGCKLDLVQSSSGDVFYSNETGIYRLRYDPTRSPEGGPIAGGKELYELYCQPCHQPDGEGRSENPPLNRSEWVNGSAETMMRIVLFGLEGEIEVRGKRYKGKMLALGQSMRDEELARLLTFVRSAWDNRASEISADMVKRERAVGSQVKLQ